MKFRVRGEDEPVIDWWLEGDDGRMYVIASRGDANYVIATIKPNEPVYLPPVFSADLGIPLTPEGRIQIAGQERTVNERFADEMFEVLTAYAESSLRGPANDLLARIREAEGNE